MTGPTWKFWTWTADDWPYGIVIVLCGGIAVMSVVTLARLLAGV